MCFQNAINPVAPQPPNARALGLAATDATVARSGGTTGTPTTAQAIRPGADATPNFGDLRSAYAGGPRS